MLRGSTEGLLYSRDKGEVKADSVAYEMLGISRGLAKALIDVTFEFARQRKDKSGKGCVIVAKNQTSSALSHSSKNFFYKLAENNQEFAVRAALLDAMALNLIRKRWEYDILVMGNMLADILSDLGVGLVGGMGMAPYAEISKQYALFQPAHGSAPDKTKPIQWQPFCLAFYCSSGWAHASTIQRCSKPQTSSTRPSRKHWPPLNSAQWNTVVISAPRMRLGRC